MASKKTNLNFCKLSNNAIIPTRATPGSAGYDLYALEDYTVAVNSAFASNVQMVRTGVCVEIPSGYFGKIFPRSSLAVKHSIDVGAGVIDSDYRGEIKVVLFNHGNLNFHIKKGDRIAQLVIIPCLMGNSTEVESMSDTSRGEGGFGSTGV